MNVFAGHMMPKLVEGNTGRSSTNLDRIQENQARGLAHTNAFGMQGPRYVYSPVHVWSQPRWGLVKERLYMLWYNRMHITPALLELGNVIGVQTRDIIIWNAYFNDVTLTNLSFLNGEGITAEGPPGEVQVFKPLQEKTWKISVTENGPPNIDATVTWSFEGITPYPVGITGSRLTLFSFYPTWDAGILERLEWLSDVTTGPTGIEQRRLLRLSPRRTFQMKLIANGKDRQYFDILCFDWGSRNFAIPIWPDVQELQYVRFSGSTQIPCKTAGRDFRVGGLLLFRGPDAFSAEVCEIAQVNSDGLVLARPTVNDWPIYTKIYPIRSARFDEQPSISRLTDKNSTVSVSFRVTETCDYPGLQPPLTYKGRPLLTYHPEESENLTSSYVRLLQMIDNNMALPRYRDTADLGFTVQQYRFMAYNRVEHDKLRGMMYDIRGRFRSMWVPTFYNDLTLREDIPKTSSFIEVENVMYSKYGKQQPGRRHILIETIAPNARVFARGIIDSYEVEGGKERLVLDDVFDEAIPVSRIARISYLATARMENDFVEINHQTDADGVSAAMLTFRSLRDDVT